MRGSWGGGLLPTLSGQPVCLDEGLEPDVKPTFGTVPWGRYRDLPGLRRGGANHRLHRGSGSHTEDPRSPGCESVGARSHEASTVPSSTAAGAV